jgi:hypothetical protein
LDSGESTYRGQSLGKLAAPACLHMTRQQLALTLVRALEDNLARVAEGAT